MNEYMLTCDSTADLSEEHLNRRGIPYAHFTFHMDGKDYADDYGHSMPIAVFYEKLRQGAISTTSQVSLGEYEAFWEPYLAEGKDILHLTLSSGISGSYNAALVAAEELRSRYPKQKVVVIDSQNASSGYGLLVDIAADGRDQGLSLQELEAEVLRRRDGVNAWFFTSDLTWFWRGGRLSKTAFVLGTALKVCPLMRVNLAGALVAAAKLRGKQRAMEACEKRMVERADGGTDYSGYCYISQSACLEDANALKALIERDFPKLVGKVRIFQIGTVIGSHTGPGTVALFFEGKAREA